MSDQLRAILNKITSLRYQIIELELRGDRLTEIESATLEELREKYDAVSNKLNALKVEVI